ncbi:hypothetical protein PMIN02_001535 [Paraphaeosphaeria minitans]|uniref:RelA/SpoT domain-containing protein n=1 Tax=Paraphaeosphaeria minitans TaxID=565426 RepID=A0A9P6GK42_9PLEO|nr:hypothetical protein PMIN01_04900 [Paraphaeosphaeria minitans]
MSIDRVTTLWPSDDAAPIVESLVKDYHFEHYHCLAERVEEELKKALKKEARLQPWMTTFRAKSRESLREKLIVRHAKMDFKTSEEVISDTWDLAGVRVILYFPSEQEHNKVQEIIHGIWGAENVQRHVHPRPEEASRIDHDHGMAKRATGGEYEENSAARQTTTAPSTGKESIKSPRKYQPRHMGYRAVHYVCKIDKTQENERYKHTDGDQVEIQVVSALTHSWATAGHDLLYKSYVFGEASPEEHIVFDALNGIIQSGDLLLEQFQSMVHRRTYRTFESPHELGDYLQKADVLQNLTEKPCFASRGLEILLDFLRHSHVKKDCPVEVREALKGLGYPREVRPDKGIARFMPELDCVSDMQVIVCLMADNLPKNYQPRTFKDLASDCICHIMMTALKLLQSLFNLHEDANAYLQNLKYKPEEKTSVDFVLSSEIRQVIFAGDGNEITDKTQLQPAWNWFNKQKRNPKSICGLVFRVAEMELDAFKKVNYEKLLDELTIGTLSRSSTVEFEV